VKSEVNIEGQGIHSQLAELGPYSAADIPSRLLSLGRCNDLNYLERHEMKHSIVSATSNREICVRDFRPVKQTC
jgi:hypothetical protein